MKKLLAIQASLFGPDSGSSRLVQQFVDNWMRRNPEGRAIIRDLGSNPVPHLDAATFRAFTTPEDVRTPEQRSAARYSESLIEELAEADALVFGVPMYNLGVPSTLRAYFDQVARAGITFRYSETGPVGLIGDKPTYVVITRGGVYGDDHPQNQYIRQFLGLLGIRNIEFVHAEGLAMGDEVRERTLASAIDRIAWLMPVYERVAN